MIGDINMKKETLYSPKVLILGFLILIFKGILDYHLNGTISIGSYISRNFFYILAIGVYLVGFIKFNKAK